MKKQILLIIVIGMGICLFGTDQKQTETSKKDKTIKLTKDVKEFQKTMNVMGAGKKFKFERIPAQQYLKLLKKDLKLVTMKLPDNVVREDHVTIACPDGKFKLQADVYYKDKKPAKKRPCVIFMHDWAGGKNPALCGDRQGAFFALHGFVFVALYYRPPKYSPCPAALEDLKTCVRWVRSKAEEYSIDPNMIVSFGSSAGSQWAFMAGATNGDKRFEKPTGYNEFSSDINAMILHAAICNVMKDFKDRKIMEIIFGTSYKENPKPFTEFSPVHNVTAATPPFLIINGDKDGTCTIEAARELRDKGVAAGVNAKLIEMAGRDHGSTKHPEDLFFKLTQWKDFILDNWKKKKD